MIWEVNLFLRGVSESQVRSQLETNNSKLLGRPFSPQKNMQRRGTVDGRNPAPVDMVVYPIIYRFHTCQVVQDFFHQQ